MSIHRKKCMTWIKRVVENGHKYHFKDDRVQVIQNNEDDDN